MPFHRFAYSTALRDSESPRPFKTRDGAAFGELAAVLTANGLQYGSLIYNFPSINTPKIEPLDMPCPGAGELLVLTTRPPLNDASHDDKRIVPPRGNRLEEAIFAALSPSILSVCARSHVRISEQLVGPEFEKGDFVFHQNKDARLKRSRGLSHKTRSVLIPESEYRSMGFFIKVPVLPGYGCGLVVSFGMGGIENLIWNRIIRERYPDWLGAPSLFVVAEMDIGPASVPDPDHNNRLVLPAGLMTLGFADRVRVEIIVKTPLPESSSTVGAGRG